MRIWLVTIGEQPSTAEAEGDPLQRTGSLARFLAQRGHDVLWWTSSFDQLQDTSLQLDDRLRARILCGQDRVSARFPSLAETEAVPDVLVAALPTIEMSQASVDYGRLHHVPVVLDVRDMWPETFFDAVPLPARAPIRAMLRPLVRQVRKTCSGATGIIGVSEALVEWGLRQAGRPRSPLDRAFPSGYAELSPRPESLAEAGRFWEDHSLPGGAQEMVICCYTSQAGLHLVVAAAEKLNERGSPIRFVLYGDDRVVTPNPPNVLVAGPIDASQRHVLLRRSAAATLSSVDPHHLPTVAIEYLSAGLPIVAGPGESELTALLRPEQCGLVYGTSGQPDLAEVLLSFAADEAGRARMAQNAAALFERRFRAESAGAEMERYLLQVAQDFKLRRPNEASQSPTNLRAS